MAYRTFQGLLVAAVLVHGQGNQTLLLPACLLATSSRLTGMLFPGQVRCSESRLFLCRGGQGKGMVAPLVHLLVSGGPSDQARAARALSNMATDSSVKEQIVAAGLSLLIHMSPDPGLHLGYCGPPL